MSVLLIVVLLPAVARAQSAMTGVVKDTSGAVLPGVTVEAASDALIEKVKAVVSDGSGVYRITDLRPGVYSVTFSLPGFQTLKRDGLQLPAEFTMTINGDMKVGALEETITVSGDAPVVDVTTAVHTQVLNREAIDAIPTGRTIQGLGQLIVGVSLSLPDTGGARAMQQTYMSAHGMTAANNTIMVDGMIVNGLQGDGAIQSYFNDAMNQEVSYQTSGISAETSSGGVRLNMIPREGGNTFSGSFSSAYRPGAWQGSNLTQRHLDKGFTTGNATDRIIDLTGTEGGPVMKDKLWFFVSGRYISVNNFIPGTVHPDGGQGIDDQFIKSGLARLTWQITPKLKLGAYHDEVDKYRGHDMQSGWDYETAAVQWFSPAYHTNQGKITYTATSRLLLEGGFSSNLEYYTNSPQDGLEKLRGTQEWFNQTSKFDADTFGATRYMIATCATVTTCTPPTVQNPSRYNWQAAASYVTGSHNIKGGVQYQRGEFTHGQQTHGDLQQIYRSNAVGAPSPGVPFTNPANVIVLNTSGQLYGEKVNYDFALYGQDSWTMKRLSVNFGLRWEALNASVLPGTQPANRWVPERTFDEVKDVPDWKDFAPRFSMVYDLFGNSKTALKYSFNRYNQARTTGIAEAYNGQRLVRTQLTWNDLNKDDVAQGFVTYDANNKRTNCVFGTAGCEINFATLPSNFGLASQNTYGGFPRIYNLEQAVEIQHELLPRLSLTGSWFHGSFGDLTSTVNTNLKYEGSDQSLNPFYGQGTVYDPLTGQAIVAYGRRAAYVSVATANVDFVDNSDQRGLFYDAYNLEFRLRMGRGSQLFGGVAIERQLTVDCTTAQDDPNQYRFCDDRENDIPFKTQFKVAGNYPLPYGLQLSGSFQSNESPNSSRTLAAVATSRYPAGCPAPCPVGALVLPRPTFNQTSLTVNLIPTSAARVERINQLDVKLQRNFKVNRVTVSPVLEIFNINNSDAIISYVSTSTLSGSGYLKPNSIMQPRVIGVGANIKW